MKSKIKVVLLLVCAVVLFSFSGCSTLLGGLEMFEKTNTTVDEAMVDIAEINAAIVDAKRMVQNKDDSVYGDLVHTDSVSFKDVVTENELKSQAATKKIDGTSYYLYWDNSKRYPFWSTDGYDDIRNSQENMIPIKHEDTIRIKNKTNVTALN